MVVKAESVCGGAVSEQLLQAGTGEVVQYTRMHVNMSWMQTVLEEDAHMTVCVSPCMQTVHSMVQRGGNAAFQQHTIMN